MNPNVYTRVRDNRNMNKSMRDESICSKKFGRNRGHFVARKFHLSLTCFTELRALINNILIFQF